MFSAFHDGTILSCEPIENGYRFTIDCLYIAQCLNPEFEFFYLDIIDAKLFKFAPRPFEGNVEYENITFKNCFQYEPEIINSECEVEGKIKVVFITSEFQNPPYSGAEVTFTASGILLYDHNKQILELDDFFALFHSYWDSFGKK